MDYAVLFISASESVQSHTETVWQLLERYHVPDFLFINKMALAPDSEENIVNFLFL